MASHDVLNVASIDAVLASSPTSGIAYRRPVADDLSFVLSSWKHGLRKLPEFRSVPNERFYPWIGERVERLLRASSTMAVLAADGGDSWQVYGYVIASPERNALIWVYVKQALRHMGIASTLISRVLDTSKPVAVCHDRLPPWLGSFATLAKRHNLVFDPTLIG